MILQHHWTWRTTVCRWLRSVSWSLLLTHSCALRPDSSDVMVERTPIFFFLHDHRYFADFDGHAFQFQRLEDQREALFPCAHRIMPFYGLPSESPRRFFSPTSVTLCIAAPFLSFHSSQPLLCSRVSPVSPLSYSFLFSSTYSSNIHPRTIKRAYQNDPVFSQT